MLNIHINENQLLNYDKRKRFIFLKHNMYLQTQKVFDLTSARSAN